MNNRTIWIVQLSLHPKYTFPRKTAFKAMSLSILKVFQLLEILHTCMQIISISKKQCKCFFQTRVVIKSAIYAHVRIISFSLRSLLQDNLKTNQMVQDGRDRYSPEGRNTTGRHVHNLYVPVLIISYPRQKRMTQLEYTLVTGFKVKQVLILPTPNFLISRNTHKSCFIIYFFMMEKENNCSLDHAVCMKTLFIMKSGCI